MKAPSFRAAIAAVLLGLSAIGAASAQQPTAPSGATPPAGAAPPAALPAPAKPNPQPEVPPEKLAVARDLIRLSGMARSIEPMVPQLEEQIPVVVTRTRPELGKEVNGVLVQLQPEFAKKTDEMLDNAARIYAAHMSEDELKATVDFFKSPAGRRYVEQQPFMLDELVISMQGWTQQTSSYMMKRVQAEMEKKGFKF